MLELIRGDTEEIAFEFLNDEDAVFVPDMFSTGDIFTLSSRDFKGELVFCKRCVFPDTVFSFSHEETKGFPIGEFSLDLEYKKPDESVVKTVFIDKVKIVRDVTY